MSMDNLTLGHRFDARSLPVPGPSDNYTITPTAIRTLERPLPLRNQILAALEPAEFERLRPHLDFVQLPLGLTLHEISSRSRFAYFPTAGIVSPVCMMKDGAAAAVAVTGNDGMIGTSLFMNKGGMLDCAVVQSAGHAYRLGANRLKHEFERGGGFSKLLLQYTHSLLTQMAKTAVCNRYHTIEQQLCRWLLLMLDRMPNNELSMTHAMLSRMLGVRREGITAAAGKLQKAGVIRYHRGHITALDHIELTKRVCECYT
jgi:hypothetical protein